MEENYIVYEVTYKGKVIYIGSGKPERSQHVMSGKSHNVELNRLFFTDPDNMKVTIIREQLTKEESLEMEKGFIQATEPMYNIALTSRSRKVNKRKPLLH